MDIRAELITIGNELLSGRTLNTHARDLGLALSEIGCPLTRDTTIPDDLQIIAETVRESCNRVPILFISGGLGPTVDDITRDALSSLLKQAIIMHLPTAEHLKNWFKQKERPFTEAAARQALILEKATVLPNPAGLAPGQLVQLSPNQLIFILPGPPHEFNAILHESIVPLLSEKYPQLQPNLISIIQTAGMGESDIATRLEAAHAQPTDIDIGFYAAKGHVEIRLTAPPEAAESLKKHTENIQQLLFDILVP